MTSGGKMKTLLMATALLIGVAAAHADDYREEKTLAKIIGSGQVDACEQVGELHLLFAIRAHNQIASLNKSWNELPLPSDCAKIDGGTQVLILDRQKSNDMWDDSVLVHLPLDRYPEGSIPNLWVQAGAIDLKTVQKREMTFECALYVREEKCK
jgi:hypothetical protein